MNVAHPCGIADYTGRLLYRRHPTRGWQHWSSFHCAWRKSWVWRKRVTATPDGAADKLFAQVSWVTTWAEPELL